MTDSREKGKRGERELAQLLREEGFGARRGQQYSGAAGDADVVGLPGIHVEVKRVERLELHKAVGQAVDQAWPGERPAVFHRRNGTPWLVTMPLADWLILYRRSGMPGAEREGGGGRAEEHTD